MDAGDHHLRKQQRLVDLNHIDFIGCMKLIFSCLAINGLLFNDTRTGENGGDFLSYSLVVWPRMRSVTHCIPYNTGGNSTPRNFYDFDCSTEAGSRSFNAEPEQTAAACRGCQSDRVCVRLRPK